MPATAHYNFVDFCRVAGTGVKFGISAFFSTGITQVDITFFDGVIFNARTFFAPSWDDEREVPIWSWVHQEDMSVYLDGPVTINAWVTDASLGLYFLPAIIVQNNSGGTLTQNGVYVSPDGDDINGVGSATNPYRTIARAAFALQSVTATCEGQFINLMEGDHRFGDFEQDLLLTTTNEALIIRAAPGADKDLVRITSCHQWGINCDKVKFEEITFALDGDVSINHGLRGKPGVTTYYWYHRCTFVGGTDPDTGVVLDRDITNERVTVNYFTQCVARQVRAAFVLAQKAIGCAAFDVKEHAYSGTWFVCSCIADGVGEDGNYPDVYRFWGSVATVIVYGLRAVNVKSGHGLYLPKSETLQDCAVVNVVLEAAESNTDPLVAVHSWLDHVMLWHITVAGQAFEVFSALPNPINGCDMRNIVMQRFRSISDITGWLAALNFQYNHFVDGSAVGTNTTSGDPIFRAPAVEDFTIEDVNSPSYNSGLALPDTMPTVPEGVGAGVNPTRGGWLNAARDASFAGDGDRDMPAWVP